MKVYTRIDGELTVYEADTDSVAVARAMVRVELASDPAFDAPVLAVVDGGIDQYRKEAA